MIKKIITIAVIALSCAGNLFVLSVFTYSKIKQKGYTEALTIIAGSAITNKEVVFTSNGKAYTFRLVENDAPASNTTKQ